MQQSKKRKGIIMRKSILSIAAATAVVTLFGDGLAPLNPEFVEWSKGRTSLSPVKGPTGGNVSGGSVANPQLRVSGVVPSPFDRSYLKSFYVDGEAVSPIKPRQVRLLASGSSSIPSSYDTRVDGKGLTPVKDQSPYGTCWAHATCGCLEAWLLNAGKGTFDLSENNLVNLHGIDWSFREGGNGDVASAYLLRWSGPVLEASDRYPNIGGSPSNLEPILHLQNVKWIPGRLSSTDNAIIKRAVMKYGAVSVDYYHEPSASGDGVDLKTKTAYWNPPEGAYYRSAYHEPNHEVCIVGWDDGYSAGRFSTRPPTDGAFLIKNSWGTGFGTAGNKGFCWISYHDATLAQGTSYVFADTESVDNYDDIYQYDPLGLVGTYGYCGGTLYGASMFTAREDLNVAAVGFYLPEPYAQYEISIYSGCSDGKPTSDAKIGSASGSANEYAGYVTVPVSCSSSISKGARFSAVVKITTASERQLAIEYPEPNYSSGATAKYGETFISDDGTTWTDFKSKLSNASFCCKVYSKRDVAPAGSYTVQFAANGGTGSMADRIYSYGKSYTLPANAFAKDGYSFTGWKWSGGQFADCDTISFSSTVSSPLTLTAQWQKTAASKPSRPVISGVTQGDLDSISVFWTSVPGAKSYNLYWCATEEFPSTQTPINVTGTAYLDTERMPGLEIYYWVSAVNDAGESAVSVPVSGYRAATCAVSPVSTSYPASGADGEVVTVEANTSWRVLDSASWIHITDGMGAGGTDTFSYSVDANDSTQSRNGSITVGTSAVDHRVTRTISVYQAGKTKPLPGVPELNMALYTANGFYLSWEAASNAKTYKVYRSPNPDHFGTGETCIVSGLTTTSYTDSTANWIFAYDYRVAAVNDEGETSGPVVTLQGNLSGSTVVIPSMSSATFPVDGGHASVIVHLIGSTEWEASSFADWLTLSTTAGSSGGSFTVTASKNTTSSKRTATVLIGAGSKIGGKYLSSATVTFTQEAGDGSGGSSGEAAQADVTLPSRGGMEYAYVKTPAGEKWEFQSANKPSWITGISLDGTDVTRSSSFSVSAIVAHTWSIGFSAAENTGGAREWAVPIMRDGVLIGSLVVSQKAAGDNGGSGGDDSDVIPVDGGTKRYSVTYPPNETWKFDLSKRPGWVTGLLVDGDEYSPSTISFSKSSDHGGTVVITATASANTGAERTWSIPITCGSASRGSVDIVQAGNAASGLPAVPDTPVATVKDATTVEVSWKKSAGATKYKLWRADGGKYGDADFKVIATPTGTTYTDKNLKPETTYSYKVSAVNAKGEAMCQYMESVTTPAKSSGGTSGGGSTPTGVLAFGPGEGSKFSISSSGKAVVVGVSSLTWSRFSKRAYLGEQSEDDFSGHSFYTFDDSRIVDAEKNSTKEDFDDCWCSALSEMNAFFWAGWIGGYADEDLVKNYMRERADEADYDTYGWDFYDLVSPSFSESTHMGAVANISQFTKAFESADRLFCLTVDFDSSFIWKGERGVSHGVVCCGYSRDPRKAATSPDALNGLFIIDSDSDMYNGAGGASAPDAITYCPVRWNPSKRLYEIDNVFGATGSFSFDSMYYIRTRTSPTVHFTVESDFDADGIFFNTESEYVTNDDGAFMFALLELVESGSAPKLTVKGLPSGLKYDAKSGVISGKATKPGTYKVTVSATNATVKKPVTAEFEIVVPNLASEKLPGLEQDKDAYGVVMCGVELPMDLVDCTPEDGWTVKVAGLPAGLKFTAKDIMKKGSKTEVEIPANTIYGVSTKTGTFTVTFTASKKGEANQVATITMRFEALPEWAQGTFTGYVAGDDGEYGFATMTAAANGKVSGKISLDGTNWTFSASSFSRVEHVERVEGGIATNFVVEAVAKAGKAERDVVLSVSACDGGRGATALPNAVVGGTFGEGEVKMWRGMWKDKATAAAAKTELAKWEGVYTLSLEGDDDCGSGYLSLTVRKDGNVKATGKLADGTSVSATSPLMYDEDAGWLVMLYAAPSAYKGGAFALAVSFAEPRGELGNGIGVAYWASRNPEATGDHGDGFARELDFVGAYYNKLESLYDYYRSLRVEMDDTPELFFSYKETYLDENNRKVTETFLDSASAVDTLGQPGLTAAVNEKGAIVVEKATKPVQDKETKEWSYNGTNDGALTLSFTQATGIFKGSYTFWYDYESAYDDTTEKSTMAHTSKNVNFEGILVQGEEPMMDGFYLWDATGEYADPKTGKTKTYKYKQSFPVRLVAE